MNWINSRWHLDGKGIHAGEGMEVQFPDGIWVGGRVESADAGQVLFFLFDFHDRELKIRIDPDAYEPLPIRWPQVGSRRYQPA